MRSGALAATSLIVIARAGACVVASRPERRTTRIYGPSCSRGESRDCALGRGLRALVSHGHRDDARHRLTERGPDALASDRGVGVPVKLAHEMGHVNHVMIETGVRLGKLREVGTEGNPTPAPY